MSNSSETPKGFNPYEAMDREWSMLFNELCYEVFYKNPKGQQLLAHMENKFFRSPVAFPNKEPSWAYFNEGRNDLVRSFTNAIQTFVAINSAKAQAKSKADSELATKKGRKKNIRPV